MTSSANILAMQPPEALISLERIGLFIRKRISEETSFSAPLRAAVLLEGFPRVPSFLPNLRPDTPVTWVRATETPFVTFREFENDVTFWYVTETGKLHLVLNE